MASSVNTRLLEQILARVTKVEQDVRAVRKLLGDRGSFYETHDNVRYKRALLDMARDFQKSGGRVSRAEMAELCVEARRDGRVSDLERRTLLFVVKTLNVTNCGKEYLRDVLAGATVPVPAEP